jgi:hypothetical protein
VTPTEPDQFTTVAPLIPPPAANQVPLSDAVVPGRAIGARVAGVPIMLPDQPLHRDGTLSLSGRVQQVLGGNLVAGAGGTVTLTGVWWTYPDAIASAPRPPELCVVEPPLRFAYATGATVHGCTLGAIGTAARIEEAAASGAQNIVVAPNAGLNPFGGDRLLLGAPTDPEAEVVITAGFTPATNPDAPVRVRLRTPTGNLHRSGEPIARMQASGVVLAGAVAREAQPGDPVLFAPGLAALPTIGLIIVDQGGATESVHRARQLPVAVPHLVAPDATTGRFMWPPLGRLAQIRVHVDLAPFTPVDVDIALDYAAPPSLSVILS